jgi:hypothetical protein
VRKEDHAQRADDGAAWGGCTQQGNHDHCVGVPCAVRLNISQHPDLPLSVNGDLAVGLLQAGLLEDMGKTLRELDAREPAASGSLPERAGLRAAEAGRGCQNLVREWLPASSATYTCRTGRELQQHQQLA